MNRWIGKVAVVTGASSGIGLATAQYLMKEGMIVVGLARRKAKMENDMKSFKGKGKFYAYECDISSEIKIAEAFKWISSTLGGVDVLINNAGLMTPATIFDADRDVMNKIVNVNIMGLLYCTVEAVKLMKKSGSEGHIININSILGHRVLRTTDTFFNVYPATKHAVTALTTTMEIELLGTKIRCTSISPGVVQTEIFGANAEDKSFANNILNLPALQSEDIADAIVYILGTNPRVQITELTIKPLGEVF